MALRKKAITVTADTGGVNEIQTLTLTAGLATQTFKLTFNAHESSTAVTLPVGGFANTTAAQIQTALNNISDFSSAANQPVVTGPVGGPFPITFSAGIYKASDVGAITITSKTGAADGSVAETLKGVVSTAATAPTLTGRSPFKIHRVDIDVTNLEVVQHTPTYSLKDESTNVLASNATGSQYPSVAMETSGRTQRIISGPLAGALGASRTGDSVIFTVWYESAGDTRM